MKKVVLITAAMALAGFGAVTAANPGTNSVKEKPTQTISSQTGCCGDCCSKAKGH
jgi:hypothetical protein